MQRYNESLMYAPHESVPYFQTIYNISAVLLEEQKYEVWFCSIILTAFQIIFQFCFQQCIAVIDACSKNETCPVNIRFKIGTRRVKCYAILEDKNNLDAAINDMTDMLNNFTIKASGNLFKYFFTNVCRHKYKCICTCIRNRISDFKNSFIL